MMGPERAANKKLAADLLGGDGADYDAMPRRGSFVDDDFDAEPMRRGSIGPGEDAFLARRPSQGAPANQGLGPIIEESDSDDDVDVRPRNGRINSMRRPGATSLEPMAFARERAGTMVGAMSAPWSPNFHRDGELEDTRQDSIDRLMKQKVGESRVPHEAKLLRDRMQGNTRALLPKGIDPQQAPAPHSEDEFQEMGEQMDYQEVLDGQRMRHLDPQRHWGLWTRAHPKKPDLGPFMSAPDAGWDRVQSRGFLGIPYLFSMLGSKLFGTKGGRYDRRKADLARRKGTFERAWETYGGNAEGKKGVTPDWINTSTWARGKWAEKSREIGADEIDDSRAELMKRTGRPLVMP